MENISSAVRQLPKNIIYAKYLRSKDEAYLKVKEGVFALLDCDEKGKLTKKKFTIDLRNSQQSNEVHYVCSCPQENCLHII